MRISYWSSDVCSSDLSLPKRTTDEVPRALRLSVVPNARARQQHAVQVGRERADLFRRGLVAADHPVVAHDRLMERVQDGSLDAAVLYAAPRRPGIIAELLFEEKLVLVRTMPKDRPLTPEDHGQVDRSEEHTSELQSLMRISYAFFCLKKKKHKKQHQITKPTILYNNHHDETV